MAIRGDRLDLRCCRVDTAWLEALVSGASGTIDLNASFATFGDGVRFARTTFGDEANFTGATFGDGVRFDRTTFGDEANFIGATFGDEANFIGATFGDGVSFYGAAFGVRARFTGATFGKRASFENSTFGKWASFENSTFGKRASLMGATFGDRAGFLGATFGDGANFDMTTFGDGADFMGATFGDGASLMGATFGDGADFETTTFGDGASFKEANFTGNASLDLVLKGRASMPLVKVANRMSFTWRKSPDSRAPSVNLEGLRAGASLQLQGEGEASLAQVDVRWPSAIASGESPLKLTSLEETNVEYLTLHDIDLSECDLTRTTRLSQLALEGKNQFAQTTRRTRRQALANDPALSKQECASNDLYMLEGHYRSLRKALEDSGDYPAASDLYYGQMLMRLLRSHGVERVVMELYRAVGGFGVRAWRPLSWLVFLIAASTAVVALTPALASSSFWDSFMFSFESATALTRGVDQSSDPSKGGIIFSFALRIIGPALAAFAIFALRARVRR